MEYSLRGILKLYLNCTIFEQIDRLSKREFLSEEGQTVVVETLSVLKKVFYQPLPKEKKKELEADRFDSRLQQFVEQSPWVSYADNTKKKRSERKKDVR